MLHCVIFASGCLYFHLLRAFPFTKCFALGWGFCLLVDWDFLVNKTYKVMLWNKKQRALAI